MYQISSFFKVKFLAGLPAQVFHSQTISKLNIKLLYKEERLICTKTELSNFSFTLALAKLDIVSSRLASDGFIFSDGTPIDIQLATF